MSQNLFQRRRLLLYSGLGIVGAGMALASRSFRQTAALATSQSTSPDISKDAPTRIAAGSDKSLPEFQGISEWLNSSPLVVADLKGKVTLVQFWTFSCINCQRTLPYVVQWHQKYADQGLKVIGVHTPEFSFERDKDNIQKALNQHQITYAVPVDNDYKTWGAYGNNYWPHLYLADRQGILRYDHVGEGAYDQTEQTIRQLLSQA
jgi:thiol-disulfide isomerase/thioredoxin